MIHRHSMFIAILCATCAFVRVSAAADLQPLLQSARILLDQPTPDVDQLHALDEQLRDAVLSGQAERLQDSTCHTIALIARAVSADPQSHEWALELCTDDPTAPWVTYALPFIWPQSDDPIAKLNAADRVLNLCGLFPHETWSHQLKSALFMAYASEQMWEPASFLGSELLRDRYAFPPAEQLALANCFLRSARLEQARELLYALSAQSAPNSPQAVRGAVELGLIEQVLRHDIQSKQQFETAWQVWSKNKKKPGFSDPLVQKAAARARWELLQFDFAALEKTLNVSLEWQAREAVKWCDNLEQDAASLLLLAPDYETAVTLYSGRLQRLEGDALIRLGMYSSRPDDQAQRPRHLSNALDAYNQAADLFVLAVQREVKPLPEPLPNHWSTVEHDFASEARQSTYDLYKHVAGQLERWSESQWHDTPMRSLGEFGYSQRFDAIVQDAFPVLEQAVQYRLLAWRYAHANKHLNNSDLTAASLYQDLHKPLEELRRLCGSQWQTVAANATQIARTLTATGNPDAASSMSENLTAQVAEAKKLATEAAVALDDLYTPLFTAVPERSEFAVLAEHKLALDREYARLNRTLHETLDLSTHSLDRRDPQAASLRSQLYKISSRAADEELNVLESGYAWAQSLGFIAQGGNDLYARLSERDPGKYPLRGGVWQAGR